VEIEPASYIGWIAGGGRCPPVSFFEAGHFGLFLPLFGLNKGHFDALHITLWFCIVSTIPLVARRAPTGRRQHSVLKAHYQEAYLEVLL